MSASGYRDSPRGVKWTRAGTRTSPRGLEKKYRFKAKMFTDINRAHRLISYGKQGQILNLSIPRHEGTSNRWPGQGLHEEEQSSRRKAKPRPQAEDSLQAGDDDEKQSPAQAEAQTSSKTKWAPWAVPSPAFVILQGVGGWGGGVEQAGLAQHAGNQGETRDSGKVFSGVRSMGFCWDQGFG